MVTIERIQTGVRMEKRLVKVLKALAEYHDLSLGDLLEGIVLHAFEGKGAFQPAALRQIAQLKRIYGLDLGAGASHRLRDGVAPASKAAAEQGRAKRPRRRRGAP